MSHSCIGSVHAYETQQALPNQTQPHRHANATNIAMAQRPKPRPKMLSTAMTRENPLGSSLLTRKSTLDTDCLF